jgi:hypothetical protein
LLSDYPFPLVTFLAEATRSERIIVAEQGTQTERHYQCQGARDDWFSAIAGLSTAS